MDDFLSCMRFCCQSRPFPAEKDVVMQVTVSVVAMYEAVSSSKFIYIPLSI